MAETPLSPVLMELHSNNAVHENDVENSNSAVEVAANEVVDVDSPCPTLSQLTVKPQNVPTNNSESEGEAPIASNNAQTSSDAIDVTSVPDRIASPPPNCAICLGRCRNKCYTDSCRHQFCFKCLCEWSKVKPECPLCKQTFKSIIHNVKSSNQYEEYHVQPPTVQIHHAEANVQIGEIQIRLVDAESLTERPIFQNYTALNALALHRGNLPIPGGGVILPNRSTDGPLTRALFRSNNIIHVESLPWRSHIYQMKLYALPVCDITGRFRDSSARYYRNNPAQVHRLVPFIERDMQALLRNSDIAVNSVMESITESLSMMSITSPAFRRRIRPILGDRTSHFIHEINNFARSPYDMLGYDRVVHYMPQLFEDIMIELGVSSSSSGDEDFQFRNAPPSNRTDRNQRPNNVFSVNNTAEGSEVTGISMLEQPAAINLSTHNRAENAVAATAASVDVIELDDDDNEAQAADNQPVHEVLDEPDDQLPRAARAEPQIMAKVNLINTSSDECEFVLARKPPHLRTPELVSLNSESDSDVQFVEETKLPANNVTKTDAQNNENKQQIKAVAESKSKATPKRINRRRVRRRKNSMDETSGYEGLYMGASTSSGIRSSQRKQPATRRQRRKHESDKASEGIELAEKYRSRSSSSNSSDEDLELTKSNKSKKLRNRKDNAKIKVKTNKKPHARKRRHTCSNDSSGNLNSKQKSLKMQLSGDNSESSSDDDDCVNLKQLKTRLTLQKQQMARFSADTQSTNSAGSSNSSVHVEMTSSGTEISITEDNNKQLSTSNERCAEHSSHSNTSNSSSDSEMSASDESKNDARETVKSEQNSYHSNSTNSSSDSESSGTVKQHHITVQNKSSAISLQNSGNAGSSSSSSNSLSSSDSENTSADEQEQKSQNNNNQTQKDDIDVENTSLSNTDDSSAAAVVVQPLTFSQPESPDNQADRGEIDSDNSTSSNNSNENAAATATVAGQANAGNSENAELELREEDYIWLEEILRTNGHSDLLNETGS